MTEVFEARNDLERQLVAAQEGKIAGEDFLQELLAAQVFMPVKDSANIGGLQTDRGIATPLTVSAEDGCEVLLVFTSPDRAKGLVKEYPKFGGGLLVEFEWILKRIGMNVGIALNPGWEVGMDMEPDMVAQLAQAHTHTGKPDA